jgi:hypothetical protein
VLKCIIIIFDSNRNEEKRKREREREKISTAPAAYDQSLISRAREIKILLMTFNKVHIEYISFKLLICDNEDSFFYPC